MSIVVLTSEQNDGKSINVRICLDFFVILISKLSVMQGGVYFIVSLLCMGLTLFFQLFVEWFSGH